MQQQIHNYFGGLFFRKRPKLLSKNGEMLLQDSHASSKLLNSPQKSLTLISLKISKLFKAKTYVIMLVYFFTENWFCTFASTINGFHVFMLVSYIFIFSHCLIFSFKHFLSRCFCFKVKEICLFKMSVDGLYAKSFLFVYCFMFVFI